MLLGNATHPAFFDAQPGVVSSLQSVWGPDVLRTIRPFLSACFLTTPSTICPNLVLLLLLLRPSLILYPTISRHFDLRALHAFRRMVRALLAFRFSKGIFNGTYHATYRIQLWQGTSMDGLHKYVADPQPSQTRHPTLRICKTQKWTTKGTKRPKQLLPALTRRRSVRGL